MVKKKIVVLGGGNGASFMLRALKQFCPDVVLAAVIAMSDSGGSSGFLRKKYGVLPPSDVMRAILALSSYDSDVLRNIFYQKRFPALKQFTNNPEHAVNLGNMLLTFLQRDGGGIIPAITVMEEALATLGRVLPVTTDDNHLCAELSDGSFTTQECDLDEPRFERNLRVERIWIEPECDAYAPALEALRTADYVFFGPGDLYTSIIATLVPRGIWGALGDSQAKFIQIVARTKHRYGEPSPTQLSGVVSELQKYLPRPVDMVVYNNAVVSGELADVYAKQKWLPLEHDVKNMSGVELRGVDFEYSHGGYSWEKITHTLKELLGIL